MWTRIKKNEYNDFIDKYPNLGEFKDELILYNDKENDIYYLPRHTYKSYPSPELEFKIDKNWSVKYFNDDIKFSGELRPNQKPVVDKVLNILNNEDKLDYDKLGIIKAIPGFGKTFVGIYIASQLKYKTIIMVDKELLIYGEDQWLDNIIKFTNLEEKDIGIIKGDIFTATEDTPIILGMVQTFTSRSKEGFNEFYKKIRNLGINLVFFDECHKTTAGSKYARCSLFFNTKNILGLSATPYANNLHKIMIDNTVGKVISENKKYELKPKYYAIKYNSGLHKNHYKSIVRCRDFINRRGMYNKILYKSTEMQILVKKLCEKCLEKNHRIMIICWTKKQLLSLSDVLTENGFENRRFYGKEKEIDKSNDKIVVATYKYASEAFNMVKLSALIIICPLSGKKSLIQSTGRILREYDGKSKPVVFQLIDSSFNGMFTNDIPKIEKIIIDEFKCEFKVIDL